MEEKTIVAISTALGNGGISVIRMSGKDALEIASKVFKSKNIDVKDFEPRKLYLGEFDCVLCDVPCSGLGIIRRKPDIKYKDFEEFNNLPQIQFKILENAKKYLKSNGKLLYSTCTLRKAENEEIVNEFLANNKDFTLKYSHTFMPHIDGTDGFFCALLERI